MKKGILFKIFLGMFLSGFIPILLYYFLAIQNFYEIERIIFAEENISVEALEKLGVLFQGIQIQSAIVALFAIILIIFFSMYYGQKLTIGIKKLIRGTEKISMGKLDARIVVKTNDELEILAESFNEMALNLKKTSKELAEERASLKIKVEARSRELKELVGNLDNQVKEKTNELQKKIKELEKINNLMIGRELKMAELKREIVKLKTKK